MVKMFKYRIYLRRNHDIGYRTKFYEIDLDSLVKKIINMGNKHCLDVTLDEDRIMSIHNNNDGAVDVCIDNISGSVGTSRSIRTYRLHEQIPYLLTCPESKFM